VFSNSFWFLISVSEERASEIIESKIKSLFQRAAEEGISIVRIAQIFRERNLDISTQHWTRAIRLFVAEGEGTNGKPSIAQGTGSVEKAPLGSVTYQVPEPPSALVREEDFA
jgi:hypothetical protein